MVRLRSAKSLLWADADLVLIFVSRKRTSTPGSKGALTKCAELIGNPNLSYSSYWLNLIIRWSEAVTCVCTQYLHMKTFSLLKLHFSFNMLIIPAASFISLIKNIYSLLAKAHTEKLCSSTLYHCKDKRLDVKTFYRLSDVMRGNRTFLIRVKLEEHLTVAADWSILNCCVRLTVNKRIVVHMTPCVGSLWHPDEHTKVTLWI